MANYSRIEINGVRHYATPVGTYPSVTAIISGTEDPKSRIRLGQLAKQGNNAAEWERRRNQGTLLHELVASYLAHKKQGWKWDENRLPEAAFTDWATGKFLSVTSALKYQAELDGLGVHDFLSEELRSFCCMWVDDPLWVEEPLDPDHHFCYGDDGHPRIWSPQNGGWAGCPDIRAKYRGDDSIIDIKTSMVEYRRWKPNYKSEDWKGEYGGWCKWKKVCLQLVAYDLAFQKTLSLPPAKKLMVAVAMPKKAQIMEMTEQEREQYTEEWLGRVTQFHSQNAIAVESATEGATTELCSLH